MSKDAPAIPFSSPFRFQREARADILGFLTKWAELGGVVRFQSPFFVAYLVTAPEAVQHILQDNNRNYVKDVRSARIFRVALGDGMFLGEGDKWRTQRKVAQPAFHRQRLAGMAASMADATDTMLERWEQFAVRDALHKVPSRAPSFDLRSGSMFHRNAIFNPKAQQ